MGTAMEFRGAFVPSEIGDALHGYITSGTAAVIDRDAKLISASASYFIYLYLQRRHHALCDRASRAPQRRPRRARAREAQL